MNTAPKLQCPRRLASLIDSIPEVLFWYGLLVVASGAAIHAVEHWSPAETLWWQVVTLTTTGYGDIAPKTAAGRWVAAGLMLGGWVFNLLLGAQLAAKLIVNSDAWTHAEQEQLKTDLAACRRLLEEGGKR